MDNCKLLIFSYENLLAALANEPWCRQDELRYEADPLSAHPTCTSGYRAKYLFDHLERLDAKCIVVENEYIDSDYLDDFVNFYAKCHKLFHRRCKRLHFFKRAICESELISAIEKGTPSITDSDYLGFVVARPLPDAIIGRTVLRMLQNGGTYAVREYRVNLFGLELKIDSLAFQEQDEAVAACATVAVWTALHKTAELFQFSTLTPATITRVANQSTQSGRVVPSTGLNVQQICSAIRYAGLEAELVSLRDNPHVPLSSVVYGYLRMGLPVIVGMRLADGRQHAVTVSGFGASDAVSSDLRPKPKDELPLLADRITNFFVHDDQTGPFAPFSLKYVAASDFDPEYYHTAERNLKIPVFSGTLLHKPTKFAAETIIVPIYHKVRLTWTDVAGWVGRLHRVFEQLLGALQYEWDIYLTTTNTVKHELKNEQPDPLTKSAPLLTLDPDTLRKLLFYQHPRFAWRAILRIAGKPFVELLIDATDLRLSYPVYFFIWRDTAFRQVLTQMIATLPAELARQGLTVRLRDSLLSAGGPANEGPKDSPLPEPLRQK